MGLFSPGKMRFFSPRKKKAVLEEEEPVSASPLGDASTHAAHAAYESSFPRRDRRDVAPVVLHVAVASPAPPSPARAEASRDVGATTADERRPRRGERRAVGGGSGRARDARTRPNRGCRSFVSRSARGVADAEGVDDTAKRLRLEAFPRSLLSCAVADREKGWIFPSASLWARNPGRGARGAVPGAGDATRRGVRRAQPRRPCPPAAAWSCGSRPGRWPTSRRTRTPSKTATRPRSPTRWRS